MPNPYFNKVVQLSIPMAITQLIAMGSGFLCMTMLAKLGHFILAASAMIFTINMSISLICASLLFSLSILISHRFGAKEYEQVGSLFQQGWILALLVSIPTLLIYWNIYPILIFLHQDKNIAQILHQFYRPYSLRVLPFFFAVCNQQLCYGVQKQKIDMYANILGVIVLVVTSYIFIFGKLGMPALGVNGFAYGSALQAWCYFITTSLFLWFMQDFQKFSLFKVRMQQNFAALKTLLKVGWPISLQISAEMFSFLVSTMFMGWLGINALAAYQVIMQYQFLMLIPIFAISQASGILIGQAYGGRQFKDIKYLGQTSMALIASLSIGIGLIYLIFPRTLSTLYLNINDPANAQTLHLILILFAITAFSQFFDAIRNVLIGSLRGLLDTRFPMLVSLITIWLISIPLGYTLAFTLHKGVVGIALGWLFGMFIGVIVLLYRWMGKSRILTEND